jgi:hypothetical protein
MPAHGAVFATTGHALRPRMLTLLAGLADLAHVCPSGAQLTGCSPRAGTGSDQPARRRTATIRATPRPTPSCLCAAP